MKTSLFLAVLFCSVLSLSAANRFMPGQSASPQVKVSDDQLMAAEAQAESLLKASSNDEAVKTFVANNKEIVAQLAANCAATAKATSSDSAMGLARKSMWTEYAAAFSALDKGDIQNARNAMRRALNRKSATPGL